MSTAPLIKATPTSRYVLGPQVRPVNVRSVALPVTPAAPAPLPDAKISLTPAVDETTYTLPTTLDTPPAGGHNHPIALHLIVMPGPLTPDLEAAATKASATDWAGSTFPKTSTPTTPDHLGPYPLPIPFNEAVPAGTPPVQGISQIILEFAS